MKRIHPLAGVCAFVITCLFAISPNVSAQDNSSLRRSIFVTVSDKDGNPISNLGSADFHGKIRGKPIKVLSVSPDTQPRRMLILLDCSGSMAEQYRVARAISSSLVQYARGSWKLAFMAFSDKGDVTFDFGTPREEIVQVLSGAPGTPGGLPPASGSKSNLDALEAAVRMFGHSQIGDTRISDFRRGTQER